MKHPDGMRILWQSSAVLDRFPHYAEAIHSHARERCAAGTLLEVRGVPDILTDTSALHYRALDFLNTRALIESALRTEREGFDAIAVGCFLDPVLDELKELLDIPVLGLGESAMHLACMLGRRFAVLSHTATFNIEFHKNLIENTGSENTLARWSLSNCHSRSWKQAYTATPQPALTASGKQVGKLLPRALK